MNPKPNSIMNTLRFSIALFLALVFVFPGTTTARTPVQELETELKDLQIKWKDIDAKLAAKEKEIQSGEGNIQAAQDEFKSLIDDANDVIEQLEDKAQEALKKEPENQEVVRLLMGIMLNDAQNNRDAKVLAMGDMLIANGINPEYFTIASRAERLTIPARELFDELLIRHAEAMKNDLPRVKFSTTKGDIVIELFENEAPNSVANFVSLVDEGYYSDMIFHRVLEGFMAQGGGFKMKGDEEVGGEGPGYEIECECYTPEKRLHFPGSLSMAHRGKDTGGSQFFLTFERTSFLDGRHTCFGRIIEGMDVLDLITRTHISAEHTATRREEPIPGVTKDKIIKAEVVRKRDHKYRPKKIGVEEEPEEKEEVKEEKAETKPEESKKEEAEENSKPELDAPKSDEKMSEKEDAKADEAKVDEAKADEKKSDAKEAEKKDAESTKPDSEKADAPKKEEPKKAPVDDKAPAPKKEK